MSERSILFSLWLIAVAKASSLMVTDDPDLWGHVLYGLDHLSASSLQRTDPYSYTAYGAQWINHEWLAELLFGLGWKAGGTLGLWFLRTVLVGTTLAIIFRLIVATTRGVWAGVLVYVLCFFEILRGLSIRPQLFSYLFFTIFLVLIYRVHFRPRTSSWPLLLFPLLMALWANLHGAFVMGIGILGWLTIATFFDWVMGKRSAKTFYMTLCVASLACLATLFNPYGIELWTWLYRSLSASRAEFVTEWFPAFSVEPQLSLAAFYVATASAVLLFVKSRERREAFEWGLLAALCFLGFANNRNGVFFAIAAAVFLPKHVESLFPPLAAHRGFHKIFLSGLLFASILYAAGIHFFPGHRPNRLAVSTRHHPYNTYRLIRHNGLEGNIAVYFNWAQSAIWYLGDTSRVAFDGRFRTVYPRAVEEDYIHFHALESSWRNLIDNYDTQMILMPAHWKGAERLLEQGGWLVASRTPDSDNGENAVLLIREGLFPRFEARLAREEITPLGQQKLFFFGETL